VPQLAQNGLRSRRAVACSASLHRFAFSFSESEPSTRGGWEPREGAALRDFKQTRMQSMPRGTGPQRLCWRTERLRRWFDVGCVKVSDHEDAERRSASDAPSDALVTALLGVFPDARVLSSREQRLHERPTQRTVTRPSWYLHSLYGIWTIPWGGFRDRESPFRGTESHAARRRSPGQRGGRSR
jgi:hypothetical protein